MEHVPHSPYLRALGARRGELHPRLQDYFSAVPRGHIGIGDGTFDRAGTRRRWLRPFLRRLQPSGAIYAGWAETVPFTVHNTTVGGRAIGERVLHLPGGDWTMRDAVSALVHGSVHEQLGEPVALAAVFDVDIDDGALVLRSSRVGLRIGRVRVRIPSFAAPRIRLTERFDEIADLQHVDLRVDMPLIGRIYEYAGTFTYRIEKRTA